MLFRSGTPAFVLGNQVYHHLVFIYNSSTLLWSIYIDGVSQTLTGIHFTPSATAYNSASTWNLYALNTYAIYDDLRIYNNAISSTEVAFIYNSGIGTQADSGIPISLAININPIKGYSTRPIYPQPVINVLNSGGAVEPSATNTEIGRAHV